MKRVAYQHGDRVRIECQSPFVGTVTEDDGSEFVRVAHPDHPERGEGFTYHYKQVNIFESVRLREMRGEA